MNKILRRVWGLMAGDWQGRSVFLPSLLCAVVYSLCFLPPEYAKNAPIMSQSSTRLSVSAQLFVQKETTEFHNTVKFASLWRCPAFIWTRARLCVMSPVMPLPSVSSIPGVSKAQFYQIPCVHYSRILVAFEDFAAEAKRQLLPLAHCISDIVDVFRTSDENNQTLRERTVKGSARRQHSKLCLTRLCPCESFL